MPKRLALLMVLMILSPAYAQTLIAELLTKSGKADGAVIIKGQGFGTNKDQVKVLFGDSSAKVMSVREGSLLVQVPRDAPTNCEVVVEKGESRSQPMQFECLPSLLLDISQNPLPVGKIATARFQVFHSERPASISFQNESPAIVTFPDGDARIVRTSGGSNNTYQFQILGKSGPKLYDVGYKWSFDHSDFVTWNLPWGKVNLTQKKH